MDGAAYPYQEKARLLALAALIQCEKTVANERREANEENQQSDSPPGHNEQWGESPSKRVQMPLRASRSGHSSNGDTIIT